MWISEGSDREGDRAGDDRVGSLERSTYTKEEEEEALAFMHSQIGEAKPNLFSYLFSRSCIPVTRLCVYVTISANK